MKPEPNKQSEVSQKDKDQYSILTQILSYDMSLLLHNFVLFQSVYTTFGTLYLTF